MPKRPPKHPRSIDAALREAEKRIAESDAARKQLDASRAVKHGVAAIDLAARTRRRHLDEAKARKQIDEVLSARPDPWDLPEGRTQSEPVRGDAKPLANPIRERMDLVPWDGVLAVARTMTEGVKTHDEGAWRKLSQREHISRAMRHLALSLTLNDDEPHLEHAACRILMALESEPLFVDSVEGEYYVEKD